MSPTAGDGSSKPPQTLTGRIMGAFTGPPSSGGSEARADPPEILPPDERKAAMTTLDRTETKWALGRAHSGRRRRHRDPRLLPRGEPPHKGGRQIRRRLSRRGAARGRHSPVSRHRVLGPLEAEAHALGVRSLPHRLRLHRLLLLGRVRLHRSRRLADAARLASQQVRHHRFQGHPTSGGDAAPWTTAQGSRPVNVENGFQYSGRPKATDRQQALHARRPRLGRRSPKRPSKRVARAPIRDRSVDRLNQERRAQQLQARRSGVARASGPSAPPPVPAAPPPRSPSR